MQQKIVATKIVVSLPASFSIQWVGLILEQSQMQGIDARVYHGLPKSPPPQISSIEYEARNEMYASKSVFAAIAKTELGAIVGDWVVQYFRHLKEREIGISLGLIGMNICDLAFLDDSLSLAYPLLFGTAEEWRDYFFAELSKLGK